LAAQQQLTSVNTFGGLQADSGRWLNHLAKFLPVGFYYKAFHTKALFPLWERLFRRLTGLSFHDVRTTAYVQDWLQVLSECGARFEETSAAVRLDPECIHRTYINHMAWTSAAVLDVARA
jgi:hypothetical protein